ncbi:glycosyltransferase [Paenibacillus filicis]|uniref:Glycosyltransferase n=1 Tax=Paenibacillus gyeongsangnamensis TaxID=3388067 RepID=A0ABT4QCN3_9BACL|nr:glycosyltransferase [Paenibacillus filicis]MCZ8514435.1 glycosyltransferase [Paenibacillus filicis]
MNNNKIIFIFCVNDEKKYTKSAAYIQSLDLPEGMELDVLSVTGAESMTSGYNYAMNASDAKYKVYLHQDVFIINKHFIYDVLALFRAHPKLGLLGMAGAAHLPVNGVWWESRNKFGKIYGSLTGNIELLSFQEVESDYRQVVAVDGFLMVTQYDIPWREDIFQGWHFYDLSQSMEFIKAGYEVGIPPQEQPWCIHDSGITDNMDGFEENRHIFLREYSAVYPIAEPNPPQFSKTDHQNILQSISTNHRLFQLLLEQMKKYYIDKQFAEAVSVAQIAADFASGNHCGIFTCPEMENLLIEIGNSTIRRRKPDKVTSGKVLHILTQAYDTGGHTRLAWRWIERDTERKPVVVLTHQHNLPIPQPLTESVKARGGVIHKFHVNASTLMQHAQMLYDIAAEADYVVCHIHPWDVIPVLAFGNSGEIPIIFVNHADHMFFIGASSCNVVVNLRKSAELFCIERRGIEKMQSKILPIPLDGLSRQYSPQEAKKKLGLPEQEILLLSVAAGHKYSPVAKIHFIETLLPLMIKHPNTRLLIIGTRSIDRLQDAQALTNGRIQVIDLRPDVSLYRQAADIYLDSFPFCSNTSLLESASYGIPVISYAPAIFNGAVLYGDHPSIENHMFLATNIEEYKNMVENLIINNFDCRATLGKQLQDKVAQVHVDRTYWHECLEQVYQSAEAIKPHSLHEHDYKEPQDIDILLTALHEKGGLAKGLFFSICHQLNFLNNPSMFSFLLDLVKANMVNRDIYIWGFRDTVMQNLLTVLNYVETNGARFNGFIDDDPSLYNKAIFGLPIYPPDILNGTAYEHKKPFVFIFSMNWTLTREYLSKSGFSEVFDYCINFSIN